MVNTSFMLFLPFAFLTTATLPLEALTGWMATIARFNPMTYLLAALRSLLYGGWQPALLCRRRPPSCSSAWSASAWRWPRCGDACARLDQAL